jgi:hypothetical protein
VSARIKPNAVTCAFAALLLASSVAFADTAPPLLERIEPNAGPPGTLLRITGRRLRDDTRVLLGEAELPIELRTPTLITARITPGAHSGPLRLASGQGELHGPRFIVMPAPRPPTLARITPARAGPGAQVMIEGEHFSLRLADNEVRFGAAPAIVSAAAPNRLTVIVPDGAGSVQVRVRVPLAGDAATSLPFEILPKLALHSVTPSRAAARARLSLRGAGFDPDPRRDRVLLGDQPLRVLEATSTELRVQVPDDADSGMLRVSTAAAPQLTAAVPFEVLRAPSLSGFEPPAGPPGTELRVRGAGFGSDAQAVLLKLGERPLTITALTPTELRARIPAAAESGELTLVVRERGRASAASEFVVTAPLALDEIEPREGPRGSEVVLRGRGFSPRAADQQVTFAGVVAQLTAATPEQLTVRVPDTKSGAVAVQLGAQRALSHDPFVVTQPPRIDALSAEQLEPGTELRVRGSGFGSNPALVTVALAGERLTLVSVDDTQLVAKAPEAPVSGELSVHVALQGSAVFPRPIRVVAAP